MQAARWQKIKEIFNQALEMSVLERDDFVADSCDDASMRFEIEKMLAFADDETDTLESNAYEIFTNGAKIPEKIGKYKILREIGRGGMGAVYEALYETKDFSQRVALKVIKRGMDSDAILQLSIAYEVFADVYFRRKDYEKSAKYRLKSLETDKEIYNSDKRNIEVFQRIGAHHEKLAEIFKLLREDKKAEFYKSEFESYSKMLTENYQRKNY